MKAYIIEFVAKPGDLTGKIICDITKDKNNICHTEMWFDDMLYGAGTVDNQLGFSGTNCPKVSDIYRLRPGRKLHIIQVPYEFSTEEILRMHDYWNNKIITNQKYNFARLAYNLITAPRLHLYRMYYKMTGKVAKNMVSKYFGEASTCAESCDLCLKAGGYDFLPELDERVTVPGLFYAKSKGETFYVKKK